MFFITGAVGFVLCLAAIVLVIVFHAKDKSKIIPVAVYLIGFALFMGSGFLFSSADPSVPASKNDIVSTADSDDDAFFDNLDPAEDSISNTDQSEDEPQTEGDLLEFDEKTWEDYKSLYKSHNNFMLATTDYADGKLSDLAFYKLCEEAHAYFAEASISFNYGETDYQNDYLSVFQSAALSDQLAVEATMKYLDTFKTSDLNKAQENIQAAKEALIMIASNRGKLLVDAGLSDEEIRERVEADTSELG